MKKQIFKSLRFLLFLSIAGILLYFAFRGVDVDELWNSFRNARYGYIILYLILGFISLLSRSYRWILLIEPLRYKPSFMNSLYSLNTGYLANFAFPRLGELTRCASLSKVEKIPVDKLFGTVIVERVIDVIMVTILMFVLIIFRFDFFGTWLKENIFGPMVIKLDQTIGGTWMLLLFLLGIPVVLIGLYFAFREKLSGIRFIQKIKSFVKGILDGLKTIYKLKRRWGFILHSIIIWACYWAMTYAAVFILPETSELKIVDGLFLLVVGTFGFIVPVQGGIGAYHYIVALGLTLYSIPREVGLTYATITHGAQMIMLITLGLISFLLLFSVQKKSAGAAVVPKPEKENEIN
ncbi:lysylphosphatidylglycerol synthase transmembrane domain-containing protein [Bacteroidota bacterium]